MSTNKKYVFLKDRAEAYKDNNYCAVIALAIALGISYEQSWTILKVNGRKTNTGTKTYQLLNALDSMGVKYQYGDTSYKTVKSFRGRGNYIILTCNHALCHQFGETLDHSINTKRRIISVIKINEIPVDLAKTLITEKVITSPKILKPQKPKTYKYAMVHIESKRVIKLYLRRPSASLYGCHIADEPETRHELKYVKFNEDLHIQDNESFWEVVSKKCNQYQTPRDKRLFYLSSLNN